MNKVFISRSDGNVSWGFRLQGGLEDNQPLTLTNIQPNSPADGKIDPGDILIEIAETDVTHMTHKDAIELIQRCGNTLHLTIHKVGHSSPIRKPIAQQWSYDYGQASAPMFDTDLITNSAAASFKYQQPNYEQTTDFSHMPAILAKNLGRPGGPKPFTYTPGGHDLSKLLDSARGRRYRQYRSNSEDIMNRRMIVPSEQMNQHHYAGINPIIPFSYARQQPVPPKKHIQHDTDVITQSRSFQMLEGWITDSEKSIAALVPPTPSSSSAVSQAVFDEQNNSFGRRSSSSGQTSLPSRSFRYLQEQYNNDNNPTTITTPTTTMNETIPSRESNSLRRGSDAHIPSRSFKYLQEQYATSQQSPTNQSQTVNNRDDLMEIYNKPPPSFREREPEARRYSGATVPSRSFRFLQKMTSEDQPNDLESVSGYIKPHRPLFSKYDEQNLTTNSNRFNEHPSRSFKYLQELTGEHKSIGKRTDSLSNENGTSDF
jgi:hypothetical protein